MAKKVVIVDEELTPTVLATKKAKRGSIIWLILIFAALIAAAIYLPDITIYVSEKFGLDIEIPNEVVTPQDEEEDDNSDNEEAPEIQKYALTADLSFTTDSLTLSNFSVVDNTVAFTITNSGTETVDLNEYNYYLNLYNTDAAGLDTLLERIKVTDNVIGAGVSVDVSYQVLTSESITEVAFLEISLEEYPAFTAEADEFGNASLVCIKDYETVTYSLNHNQVVSIMDRFVVSITDPNYGVLYSTYQTLSATYSTISGISSAVTTDDASLYFITSINLRTLIDGTFNNSVYYPLNTDAKVMKFELEAQGYKCS